MKKKINSFAANITKEEISNLPLLSFEGDIKIIESEKELKKALVSLRQNKILGFDTETRPSFKKGFKNKVALLQLSTNKNAFLFRLNRTGLPEELIEILSDESIIKIGTALKDDISSLQKYHSFEPKGFIDLQNFVKNFEIESKGLKKLAAIVLGNRISKSQQTSNWENEILTDSQKVYAATDAWVCLEIYNKLNSVLNR